MRPMSAAMYPTGPPDFRQANHILLQLVPTLTPHLTTHHPAKTQNPLVKCTGPNYQGLSTEEAIRLADATHRRRRSPVKIRAKCLTQFYQFSLGLNH